MIITRVEQTARFYDLRPGQLFQFRGNRTTFIMVERPRHRFYFWNGRSLQAATLETIEKGILNASTPRAREFARQAWFMKNNSRESAAWQKEIDAELARPDQLLVSQDRQTS